MIRFLARRLFAAVITLLLFATVVFFVAKVMMPGDFTNNFMPGLGEQRQVLREQLGLDRPVWDQYVRFISSFAQGKFGETTDGRPITDLLFTLLPWSVLIFTSSVMLAFVFGHWLGKVVGWSKGRFLKGAIRLGAVTTHTIFPPFLTFVLTIGFINVFGLGALAAMREVQAVDAGSFAVGRQGLIVPAAGESFVWWISVGFLVLGAVTLLVRWAVRRRMRRTVPGWVLFLGWIGANLLFWTVFGLRSRVLDVLFLLSLPMLAVALLAVGEIILVVEAAMDGVAKEEYITTARAIGLSERQVRDRHASRVALLPALSRFVVSLPFVLTGLVIVEFSFSIPAHYGATIPFTGLSSVLFASLEARDYPLVVGGLLFIGIIAVVARLVLDVLHAVLDPRIQFGTDLRDQEMTL